MGSGAAIQQADTDFEQKVRSQEVRFRALVFDLAGVLLDFGGPESLHKLSDGRVGDEEFFRFWSDAMCAHDFHDR